MRASCRARCSRSADSLRRRSSRARFLSTTAAWAAIVSSRREVALVEAVDAAEPLGDEEGAAGDTGVGELHEHGVAGRLRLVALEDGALLAAEEAQAAGEHGGGRLPGDDRRRVALVRQHEDVVAVAADGELGPRGPQQLAGPAEQGAAVLAQLEGGDGVGGEGVRTLEALVAVAQVGVAARPMARATAPPSRSTQADGESRRTMAASRPTVVARTMKTAPSR